MVNKRLSLDLDLFAGGFACWIEIENSRITTCLDGGLRFRRWSVGLLLSISSGDLFESGMISVAESYAFCRNVARTQARNFYYSFVLLENEQRDAMCAVYAFNRHYDDLSDGPADGVAGGDGGVAANSGPCS